MKLKKYWSLFFLMLLPLCLWFTFRNFPFSECAGFINSQKYTMLLFMLLFSGTAFLLMGLRWFFLLRYYNLPVTFYKTVQVRLICFFWSYITPGSQVGGEYFLVVRLGLNREKYPQIISTIILDRVSEFIGNILSVLIVIMILLTTGLRVIFLLLVVMVTGILIFLGYQLFPAVSKKYSMQDSTDPVFDFFSNIKNKSVLFLLVLSVILSPLLMFLELFIFFKITGSEITVSSALLMMGAIKMSFYAPVPGAAGFFEAAVIGMSALLQVSAAAGGAYIIYTRVRDLIQLIGGGALWLVTAVRSLTDSE